MLKILTDLIGSIFISYTVFYIAMDLNNKKEHSIDKLLLIGSLAMLLIANYYYITNEFRVLYSYLELVLVFKIMFNQSIYKTIILSTIVYLIIVVGELLFTTTLLFVLHIDQQIFINNLTGNMISNILVSLIMFIFYIITRKKLKKIMTGIEKNTDVIIIVTIFFSVFIIGFLFFDSFKQEHWHTNYRVLLNFIAILVFGIITFLMIKNKLLQHKKDNEYKKLIEYTETSEAVLIEYKKINHEFLNHLAIIRNLNRKETKKYIDKIIDNQAYKSSKWITKLSYMSSPIIKGMIFYKISKAINNNIEICINIENKIKEISFSEKDSEDISKLLAIYLDNAIEYSINNNKEVLLEIYLKNTSVIFEISNKVANEFNIQNLNKRGYSTKEKHFGLGLKIAEEIINSNKHIVVSNMLKQEYFIQKITRY